VTTTVKFNLEKSAGERAGLPGAAWNSSFFSDRLL
jgi:hypothetical protein